MTGNPDLEQFKVYQQHEELKKAHQKLLVKLDTEKAKTDALTEAVKDAVLEGLSALHIPPVAPPKPDRRTKGEEYANPHFSDLQLAKVTKSYSTEACEERVEVYADKIIELTNIQREDHPVKGCVVYALGDIVEGELIFPGQAHLIDASLYRQVTIDGPRICANFLRRLLSHFEWVKVYWIIGNHGRLGGRSSKDYNPETNADRMLGQILQTVFADEPRIEFVIPDGFGEGTWYTVTEDGNYRCLLLHGDQLSGMIGGSAWQKRILGWASGAIPEQFTDVALGHFHTPTQLTFNRTQVWVNGTTESDNEFAQRVMGSMGLPCQRLNFIDPRRGRVTASYLTWLDD